MKKNKSNESKIDYQIEEFEKFNDERGNLVVFLKKSELKKNQRIFGQIYFVTFNKKGVVRGNHYHKKWNEWFGIVSGKLQVVLENVKNKKRITLKLDADHDKYIRLKIGPYIAHAFKSLTEYAALINYADSEWSSKDTFPYKLFF